MLSRILLVIMISPFVICNVFIFQRKSNRIENHKNKNKENEKKGIEKRKKSHSK